MLVSPNYDSPGAGSQELALPGCWFRQITTPRVMVRRVSTPGVLVSLRYYSPGAGSQEFARVLRNYFSWGAGSQDVAFSGWRLCKITIPRVLVRRNWRSRGACVAKLLLPRCWLDATNRVNICISLIASAIFCF